MASYLLQSSVSLKFQADVVPVTQVKLTIAAARTSGCLYKTKLSQTE